MQQEKAVERLTTYIVCFYRPFFLCSSVSTKGPIFDLKLSFDMKMFIDKEISEGALASDKRHLWYLTPVN